MGTQGEWDLYLFVVQFYGFPREYKPRRIEKQEMKWKLEMMKNKINK